MERIYLDYAASTPVDPEVERAMRPYLGKRFGNPGSIHSFGQEAMAAVDKARETFAKILNAKFREIIFVSSATEGNNLAIRGTIKKSGIQDPRIITSQIEHESVIETCRDLKKDGAEVIELPVSKDGFVDLDKLKVALNARTVLVSIIYASNEIGVIEPIREIAEIIADFKKKNSCQYPLFHTDAAQAFQFLEMDVKSLGVDLMTVSSQKIYGPKGASLLYARENTIVPIITGGIQEFGLRAGTENVPAIVGFETAALLVQKNKTSEAKRIGKLRDYFWKELKKKKPELRVNGDMHNRLVNNINVYFPKDKAEDLIIKFDLAGIAVSHGSACAGRKSEPSHAVLALGFGKERAERSLRLTLGTPTTKRQIDKAAKRIINLVQ